MHGLERVTVELGSASYPVLIGDGLLDDPALWRDHLDANGALIVTNETVAPLYLGQLEQTLDAVSAPYATCVLPDGEQHKTPATWQQIINALLAMPANRKSTVIALGGGVIGDMAGFAAACYMRGIRVIQVPTTLLAQVDAAVGGKTGVNLPEGKNLLGAFHQPAMVLADTATLSTLGEREYRAGIAEVIKYGMIMDAAFFDWLEANTQAILQREPDALQKMVATSVRHKAAVVSADVKEQGQRALLNFGHTFGHALETLTGYEHWLHGEAVAIGMLLACAFGENTGVTPAGVSARLAALLQALRFDLSVPAALNASDIAEAMRIDKKATSAGMDLILLRAVGDACISRGHQSTQLLEHFPREYLSNP